MQFLLLGKSYKKNPFFNKQPNFIKPNVSEVTYWHNISKYFQFSHFKIPFIQTQNIFNLIQRIIPAYNCFTRNVFHFTQANSGFYIFPGQHCGFWYYVIVLLKNGKNHKAVGERFTKRHTLSCPLLLSFSFCSKNDIIELWSFLSTLTITSQSFPCLNYA